ncbi:MAG: beta-ketoacyl synthase chain length factor [Bacteroides sp.]|nr:beta-ketoacyl synthase chain length factor [Bacteroides sp.]
MPVYIQAAQAISPQDTFQVPSLDSNDAAGTIFQPLAREGFFTCIHPEYKNYINPTALRRMSPVIRMGLTTSKVCMEEAGIKKPDAILVGSGLGCVRDTAKFLNQLIDNQELLLNPTAFIQSTHNTVSGQIALMLDCRSYNLTFSQNSISFETALLEGMMMLEEEPYHNILLGGVDEVVEESYLLMQKNNCVTGPMGEGSSFFVISSEKSQKSLARVDGLEILNRCEDRKELGKLTHDFLASKGLSTEDIDLLVSGRNGEEDSDEIYKEFETLFDPGKRVTYKHLVGEYNTASAFGMWLCTKIIQDQIPIRRVLLFNQNKGRDYSWILISHPDS